MSSRGKKMVEAVLKMKKDARKNSSTAAENTELILAVENRRDCQEEIQPIHNFNHSFNILDIVDSLQAGEKVDLIAATNCESTPNATMEYEDIVAELLQRDSSTPCHLQEIGNNTFDIENAEILYVNSLEENCSLQKLENMITEVNANISQNSENFVNTEVGIDLCLNLFENEVSSDKVQRNEEVFDDPDWLRDSNLVDCNVDVNTNEKHVPQTLNMSIASNSLINSCETQKMKIKKPNKRHNLKCRRDSGEDKNVQPNPCLNHKCQNNCKLITEQERKKIFDHYYSLSTYSDKKSWLLSRVKQIPVKRRRTGSGESKLKCTREYYVSTNDGTERKVCLQFLLKTLNISHMTMRQTIENCTELKSPKPDGRGKFSPKNSTDPDKIAHIKRFIDKVPVVPSHYCRKNSKRLYFSSDIGNVTNLYRIYKEDCMNKNKTPVSVRVFRSIFKRFNIGFHVPKKDKCGKCLKVSAIGEDNLSDQAKSDHKNHLQETRVCQDIFRLDQEKSDVKHLCTSFDLQKVLNTPSGKSMLLYYSRKISVYNLSIYESKTRNGYCYIWDETQGKRGANEICTVLWKYLTDVDSRGVETISLYCDNCPGQNKNKTVLLMLNEFLKVSKYVKIINLNYLIAGHTYMPADSIHSTIERFIKNKIVYAPSQWPTIISLSRQDPKPYDAIPLRYADFHNWTNNNFNIVSESAKKPPLQISKVRQVKFNKNQPNTFKIRYSYLESRDDDFKVVNKEGSSLFTPAKSYKQNLPISSVKYKDLMKLCANKIIPESYCEEYKQMKHSGKVRDNLPESDEEDGDVNE